jgi:hypothetical protein
VDKLIAAMIVSALLQFALHTFKWEKALGKKLEAPYTYITGTIAIAAVYTVWAFWYQVSSAAWAVGGLWLIIASGGGAVLIAYIVDRWLGLETEARNVPVCGGERDGSGADRKGKRRA